MLKIIRNGILRNLVPLLLSISIVSSCMYIYCPKYILPLTAAIFFIQALVFSFYTYMSEKSMLMRFISVVGSFIGICSLVVIAISTGQNKSSIDYFVWFLSPQALVTFSPSYVTATFIVINFFISSTVYYFSAVRYRISMTFLITMIPFAFYRKEGNDVPVFFAFLLLVLYITLMIHCRNMNSKHKQKLIINTGYRKSIMYFLLLSSVLTLLIPKPQTNFATSTWLSNVIDSEKLSQYMLNKLGIMSSTASSSVMYTQTQNIHLYTFVVDEFQMNIKSQTFSKYNYSENLWSVGQYDVDGKSIAQTNAEYLNPAKFYEAVAYAAEKDETFAEKYDIEGIKDSLTDKYTKILSMVYTAAESKYYLVPTLTYSVKNTATDNILRSHNGMIYNKYSSGMTNTIEYYSQQAADDKDFKRIINNLNRDNYSDFLNELNIILSDNNEYSNVVTAYIEDFDWTNEYLSSNSNLCPESIKNLAQKITEKYDSDYEKAIAIQNYFNLNDFKYDLNYKKASDYDMSKFLFEDKRGICSDYATAMVILARSAGIPARYAEGVHIDDSDGKRIVELRDSDLHAFPELFISGYGWMTFEPTQVSEESESMFTGYIFSIIIIAAVFIFIVLIILFHIYAYPALCDIVFEYKIKKSSPEHAVIIIADKIRKYSGADESTSSDEVTALIKEKYNFNTEKILTLFDSVVYGKYTVTQADSDIVSKEYLKLKMIIKENKKNDRRGRRLWNVKRK